MKKLRNILALGSMFALMVSALPISINMTALVSGASTSTTGNGAPSGTHYTLNIIGVPKTKTADMTGDNGRRIFVPENGKTKINLTEGDYQVLDANGTDGTAAFQLPNPDPDANGTTSYSVYVRALGKPGGYANMQTCYTDTTGTWCAVDFTGGVSQITVSRTKGKSTFTNVSKDLLYVDYCTSWDLTDPTNPVCLSVTQVPLFSQDASYFWDYDNNGLKLAQFRFYEVPTVTGW